MSEMDVTPMSAETDIQKFNLTPYMVRDTIVAKYEGLAIKDLSDKEGFRKVSEARSELRQKRLEVERTRKALTEGAVKYQRTINEYAKQLIGAIEPTEDRLAGMLDAYEAEAERVKEEKRKATELRVAGLAQKLLAAGMQFDGVHYVFGEFGFPHANLKDASDEAVAAVAEKVSAVIAEQKAAEEARKAEEEKAKQEAEAKAAKERAAEEARLKAEREALAAREAQLRAEAKAAADKAAAERVALRVEILQAEGCEVNGDNVTVTHSGVTKVYRLSDIVEMQIPVMKTFVQGFRDMIDKELAEKKQAEEARLKERQEREAAIAKAEAELKAKSEERRRAEREDLLFFVNEEARQYDFSLPAIVSHLEDMLEKGKDRPIDTRIGLIRERIQIVHRELKAVEADLLGILKQAEVSHE